LKKFLYYLALSEAFFLAIMFTIRNISSITVRAVVTGALTAFFGAGGFWLGERSRRGE
jgi:predicted signal transduction protein with EAL and GGDEF domain